MADRRTVTASARVSPTGCQGRGRRRVSSIAQGTGCGSRGQRRRWEVRLQLPETAILELVFRFTNDDGPAFVIRLSFAKLVYDYYLSGLERGATTWESGETLGQHGGDAGFIMQALSEDLDLFILEYLRVNEGYC